MPKKKIIKKNIKSRTSSSRPSSFQSPKGMHDILPEDQQLWDRVRKATAQTANFYNFKRIDTPVMERAELFEVAAGATSDIVEKHMFTLRAGKDRYALRPEGTAGVVRSYVQHGLHHLGQPLKLFYAGPMFRHERPQQGRLRQFYQVGFEVFSTENDPLYDSQVIIACHRFIEHLNVKDAIVHVNTIGCKACRNTFVRKLKNYYKDKKRKLCNDCKRRFTANPLRLLDCKEEKCIEMKQSAPTILDTLCSPCKKHFKATLELLDEVEVPYQLNPYLVRGLDYYTNTVFEIYAPDYDPALAAGGRYDYLVNLLGGKDTPATGGAIGVDRVIDLIKQKSIKVGSRVKPKVFLIHIGAVAKQKSLALIEDLRRGGVEVVESLGKDSLSAQLKSANKLKSPFALILGQKEAFEGSIIIRDMKTGAQETVTLDKAVERIRNKLK